MLKTANQKRRERLIKGIEEGKSVHKSAIEAGYSRNTAKVHGKKLLKTALKEKVKETMALLEGKDTERKDLTMKETKALMLELVGLSKDELLLTLRKIATQDKDYGSALKVLTPLAKEIGIRLQEDEAKTIVPILHVGLRANPTLEGAVEAVEAIATPVIDEGKAG